MTRMGVSLASGRTNEQVFNEFVRRHPETPIVFAKQAIELGQAAADAGGMLTDSLVSYLDETPEDEVNAGADIGVMSVVSGRDFSGGMKAFGFRSGETRERLLRVPVFQLPEAPDLFPADETDYAALIVTESLNVSGTGELLQYFNLHGFESWQDVIDKALSWAIRVARDYPDRFQQNDQPFDIGLRVVLGMRRKA